MKTSLRTAGMGVALVVALVAPARAQDDPNQLLDRGRLIVYEHDVPVATERFEYRLQGDSLIVNADLLRRRRKPDGSVVPFNKVMALTARKDDFGLVNYTSNEVFEQHTTTRSILPNDTSLVAYTELDGGGQADMLVRPPGRIFAMDPGLFSLFDVVCRNLQHRILGSRPVNLVLLGPPVHAVEATATLVGADTVSWGGRRVVTNRIELRDSTTTFTMWVSPEGHMLRLENAEAGVAVMREPPPLPPPGKRPRPRPRTR